MRRRAALGALAAAVTLSGDARALTGALCQLPGNCQVAWSQQPFAQNINSGDALYLNTTSCAPGGNCYTNPGPPNGLTLNVYIEFANDATTPWTTAQKQMWVALFSALGSSTWFSATASMYPPTGVWGAQSSGASLTLTNCLSGSPAHCGDTTYSPGVLGICPTISLPSDPFGIYITLASQPNATSVSGQGGNQVQAPNGHCVFAGQTVNGSTATCWGGSVPTPFGTVVAYTQPAVSSSVSVTLATGTFPNTSGITERLYIEGGGGWYSYSTIGAGNTTVPLTNTGSPVNASPATVIAGGSNAESSPAPLTPNGCVLDNQINLALSETWAAITNFHGQGWGQYATGSTCPPGTSPSNSFPTCSHEECLSSGPNGAPSGDFLIASGTAQTPTSLTTSMFSNTYNFLLSGAWSNDQSVSDPSVGPLGYCWSRRVYGAYWNVPCRQNSDCPSVSGVCSGTALGSHCAQPTCTDGVQNGFETDTDCGGIRCNSCALGKHCATMWDCTSQIPFGGTLAYCVAGVCTSY